MVKVLHRLNEIYLGYLYLLYIAPTSSVAHGDTGDEVRSSAKVILVMREVLVNIYSGSSRSSNTEKEITEKMK